MKLSALLCIGATYTVDLKLSCRGPNVEEKLLSAALAGCWVALTTSLAVLERDAENWMAAVRTTECEVVAVDIGSISAPSPSMTRKSVIFILVAPAPVRGSAMHTATLRRANLRASA